MSREVERKRLIELLYQFKNLGNADLDESELADHLIDNGVIVPPCKIDDKVYIIEHPSSSLPLSDVVEGYVISMHWHDYGNHMRVLFDTKRIFGCFDYNVDREFNKTVFLSKAEAEYALKNRRSVSLVNGHIEE